MTALLVSSALLALLLILLAIPVGVAFHVEGVDALRGRIAVRWLFGLVHFRIPLTSAAKSRSERKAKRNAAKPPAKPKQRGVRGNVLGVLRHSAFRQRACRFVTDLIRATHLQQLRLSMRLGLGDPADTGCLWAVLGPLNAVAQNLRNAQIQIEPEFVDPVFELQAHGQFKLIPLQFLVLTIGFALSPASIQAWRMLGSNHA